MAVLRKLQPTSGILLTDSTLYSPHYIKFSLCVFLRLNAKTWTKRCLSIRSPNTFEKRVRLYQLVRATFLKILSPCGTIPGRTFPIFGTSFIVWCKFIVLVSVSDVEKSLQKYLEKMFSNPREKAIGLVQFHRTRIRLLAWLATTPRWTATPKITFTLLPDIQTETINSDVSSCLSFRKMETGKQRALYLYMPERSFSLRLSIAVGKNREIAILYRDECTLCIGKVDFRLNTFIVKHFRLLYDVTIS